MLKNFLMFVIILFFFGIILGGGLDLPSFGGDDEASREMTPTDQVLLSRTTPPVNEAADDSGRLWTMAATFGVMTVFMMTVVLMTVGRPFLREARLMMKKARPPRRRPSAQSPATWIDQPPPPTLPQPSLPPGGSQWHE